VILRTIRALSLGLLFWCAAALPLTAVPQKAGKISGVVVDPSGTPQLGATILIASEQVNDSAPLELLTNASGVFSSASLRPGLYSVRATLAGFLPAIEQHIQVSAQHTTLLEIELGSVFASFNQLRRQPSQPVVSDDEFTWVLRTSASTRPILRFDDGEVVFDGPPGALEELGVGVPFQLADLDRDPPGGCCRIGATTPQLWNGSGQLRCTGWSTTRTAAPGGTAFAAGCDAGRITRPSGPPVGRQTIAAA